MNYWIFQSLTDRYRQHEGKIVNRRASRYRQEMSAGDLVFFWLGGPEEIRGIYGWGTLVSTPFSNPDDDQQFVVQVRYDKRLKNYIPVKRVKQVDQLGNLLILRAPQATNFILSKDEAKALANLIDPTERPAI